MRMIASPRYFQVSTANRVQNATSGSASHCGFSPAQPRLVRKVSTGPPGGSINRNANPATTSLST